MKYFLDPETLDLLADHRQEALQVRLLPGFDEFVLGYADRTCARAAGVRRPDRPGRNGCSARPSSAAAGPSERGAGRPRLERSVTATPFTDFEDDVTAAVPALAAALP